ncbi:MAG: DNA-binding protein WhiA [Clostridiales Family XIII bacterium]|jgi:DNA-binding protein WhiA|nr:DNA-binding protein WhiA [Clostridiales Family XIII bacterium]
MADSFATDVKNELAHAENARACCAASELAGFIRGCGSVTLASPPRGERTGMGLKLATENAAIARRYKALIDEKYGVGARLMVGEAAAGRRSHVYVLSAPPSPKTDAMLAETGIAYMDGGERRLAAGFADRTIKRKCCRKACLRGLFLGAGTVSDPERGYNFEIVLASESAAAAVRRLLNSFTDMHARTRRRRGSHIVYLKNSEQIKDALTLMGAHAQLLKYENVRMLKEIKARANRVNNCDAANMEKSLGAAARQLEAINAIERRDGLDSLPGELIDTALTRIFHPDASLAEIGQLLNPPIGKAAVSARFRRIEEYAIGEG